MKTKFVHGVINHGAVFACLFVAAVFLAGCQPVSQGGDYRGGGSASGGSSDGKPSGGSSSGGENPPSIENQIPGTYTGNGYTLLFRSDKTGNITGGSPNIRVASPDTLQTGDFNWSVSSTTVTIKMKYVNIKYEATYSSNTKSLTINKLVYSRIETPPQGETNLPQSPQYCEVHDWKEVYIYLDEEYHLSYECSVCNFPIRERHTFFSSSCRYCSANGENSGGNGGEGSFGNEMGWNAPAKNVIPRLVVLSKNIFKHDLQEYIKHKTVQGFPVTEIYTDSNSATEIRDELITIYNKDPSKPMAVLIIGDGDDYYNKQKYFPTFDHTITVNGKPHQTDFYFGEYTGDWIQEATVGRFPVKSSDDLKAIMKKIIFMENEVTVGNTELKNFLAVKQRGNAVSEFSTAKNQAESYGLRVTDIDVTSVSSINDKIDSGVGVVFYAGHGFPNTWANSYMFSHVRNLTNTTSYPVVIASTCLSGSYANLDSICKDFVNQKDGGAIAYIGASNESYFPPNRVFTTGIQRSTYIPGLIKGMYYDDSYDEKYKARNLGELMHIGQNATRNYLTYIGSTTKHQLEVYNLMGDPTYMPYTDKPQKIYLDCSNSVSIGGTLTVNTGAAYAQVALTQTDSSTTGGVKIIDATIANASGVVTLNVAAANVGEATLYAIAKNYKGETKTIRIE